MNKLPLYLPALLLCGCASAPYAAYAIEDDAELVANVVVADRALQDVVRVGTPLVERTKDTNLLRVVVPVRNIDDETIQVLAQISFRNAQQQSIGDTSNRQVAIIAPGSTMDMQFVARTTEARDYVLRLSWNK